MEGTAECQVCSSMLDATKNGHEECMKKLLKKMHRSSDSPQVFADVSDAVSYAAQNDKARTFKMLIYWGAVCSNELVTELAAAGKRDYLAVACIARKAPADACVAAEAGNLECFKVLLASCRVSDYPKAAAAAAAKGKVDFLRHIRDHLPGKAFDHSVAFAAARRPDLNCLCYLREEVNFPFDARTTAAAAEAGAEDCLKYLLETCECRPDAEALAVAAEHGHRGCIKLLAKANVEWNILHTAALASQGHGDALKVLLEPEEQQRSAPIDSSTLAAAASGGQLVCLDYLYKQQQQQQPPPLLPAIVPEAAARNGKMVCLEQVRKWGCEWGQTAVMAAAYGHDDCLKSALDLGCPAPPAVAAMAARKGNIDALELIRGKCNWDCSATAAAASYNHYDCLRWLVEKHNCPVWSSTVAASPYIMGVLHGRAAMLVTKGDVNARVLMFAKRCRAKLPPDAEAEVRGRRERAIRLAACFWKACKLIKTPQMHDDMVLWAAMSTISEDLLKIIAKMANIWVEPRKP